MTSQQNLPDTASEEPTSDRPQRAGGIARAAGIVVAMTLLSRVIGMLRDSINSAQMGVGPESDAYRQAFVLPNFLMNLIAGGALASTFVPVFSEYLHTKKSQEAWKTFSIVGTVTFVIAVIFVLIGEIWAPTFVGMACNLHPGDPRLALTVHYTRIILPAQIFFLLGGLLMGVQNAYGKFLIPALGPTLYSVGTICGALLFYHTGLGAAGMMWGALIGAIVGNFAIQLREVMRLGMRYRPSLSVGDPGAVRVWHLLLPIILGVSLPNVDQLINAYFAASLPVGSVSNMDTANRIMLIPIGVFAQAMSIAIFPTMSFYAAANRRNELRATINKGLHLIAFLTAPSAALLFLLGTPIIAILNQHHKFTAANTLAVTAPLRMFALGIVAWSAQALLTRAYYSLRDSRTPVISGTIMTVVFIAMNWAIVKFHAHDWGMAGLATATTIAATIHTIVLYVILRKHLQGMRVKKSFLSVGSTLGATAVLCLVTVLLRTILTHYFDPLRSSANALLVAGLAGGSGVLAFYAAARALAMPEIDRVNALVRRLRPA